MPNMTGFEVAHAVLADPAIRHIPLILLTALDRPTNEEDESVPDVFAYLLKPFSPLQLLEKVQEALARARTA